MTYNYVGLLVYVAISSLSISQLVNAVRPAYEYDPERCQFSNRLVINGQSAEMIEKSPGMKYFYRLNYSREVVTLDKLMSLCGMYNLEGAEILDQDDYNEVIKIVKETGWSFWLAMKGKLNPEYGNHHFDFMFMDGSTPIGFHDFGPQGFDLSITQAFQQLQEGCVAVIPNPIHPSGVSWTKVACTDSYDILCQYKKPCYKRSDYVKDPTRPIKQLIPLLAPGGDESGYAISTKQATWPYAKQVCEDAGMSLVWFEEDSEVEAFRDLMTRFSANHAGYDGKSFWTAGSFSPSSPSTDIYSKLYWWQHGTAEEVPSWDLSSALTGQEENSGGFIKLWGKEREATHLDTHEPYDEGLQGAEKCVDATFSGDHAEYFTSKCGKSLRYFICKDWTVVKQSLEQGNSSKSSFMEYCNGADEYLKTREEDCPGEVIFAGAKPECTCYSGMYET